MTEHMSPSGKYKLTITIIPTKPNCWDFAKGDVRLTESDSIIATVNRNYSAFPFLFVENHPNSHDYLICGENYQGQTVIELDTGKRLDFLPPKAKQGHGFCWASYEFDFPSQILVVDGCFWACPYEIRFYDFSDPMAGWPELELNDEVYAVGEGERKPEIQGDIIKTYETVSEKIASIKTFKREGNKLLLQEEWLSEEEKNRREKERIAEEKYEAEMKLFKETDPLYLRFQELVKEMPKAANYYGIGVTYKDWCPDFQIEERRYCQRIHDEKSKGYTIDLEWAMKTGPIKLVIFKDGESYEDKFFDHSVNGMEEAFNYAKQLLESQNCPK